MITIEILDEAKFNADTMYGHHIKHVLSTKDKDTRLDYMYKDTYGDLGEELSNAKCNGPDSSNGVVGFKLPPNKSVKCDTRTKLFTIYDPAIDNVETVFKLRPGQLDHYKEMSALLSKEKNKEAVPLPEEETEGDVFNYSTFCSKHGEMIPRGSLRRTIAALDTICIKLDSNTAEKALVLFKNTPKGKTVTPRKPAVATILRPKKGEDASIMLPKVYVDKGEEFTIDQLSLVLKYLGQIKDAKITHMYDEPNVKAFKIGFYENSILDRICPYDSTVMIIGGNPQITVADLDPEKFKPLANEANVRVTICYMKNGNSGCYTQLL